MYASTAILVNFILGIKYFPFMTIHNWGEPPTGRWTLRMETRQPQTEESIKSAAALGNTGKLSHFGLLIYGSNDPDQKNFGDSAKLQKKPAFVPTQREITLIYHREIAARQSPNVVQKRNYENLLKQRQVQKQNENDIQQKKSVFELFNSKFHF